VALFRRLALWNNRKMQLSQTKCSYKTYRVLYAGRAIREPNRLPYFHFLKSHIYIFYFLINILNTCWKRAKMEERGLGFYVYVKIFTAVNLVYVS
jgi:hypothetical protein